MKVLHLSTSDVNGGAARAAYRLHQGLLDCGIKSYMLSQYKDTSVDEISGPKSNPNKAIALIRTSLDNLPKLLYRNRSNPPFHLQWIPDRLSQKIRQINPDVVHLHWVCKGFVNVASLAQFNKPIIWTLHDMWPFTGGCHYAGDCNRYKYSCGACPQLQSGKEIDLSRWTWKRKNKYWKNINIRLISPSKWIQSKSAESSLFKYLPSDVIPYCLDMKRFHPANQDLARSILDLPLNKTLILFGAMNASKDERKGFQYLIPALKYLSLNDKNKTIELVVLGSEKSSKNNDVGFKIHNVGTLRDEISIALVYAACDVFVAPSQEDNLPNTVLEAMCCGVPCVAFDIGGMRDMIVHKDTGYLAKPFLIDDLAKGIAWVTDSPKRRKVLSTNARKRAVTTYDIVKVVKRHLEVYGS